jgi:hypothetical protein
MIYTIFFCSSCRKYFSLSGHYYDADSAISKEELVAEKLRGGVLAGKDSLCYNCHIEHTRARPRSTAHSSM